MSKNFDGAAWASDHGNTFQALVAQARRKVRPKVESSGTTVTSDPELDQSTDKVCLASKPIRNSVESDNSLHSVQSPGRVADLDVEG